MVCTSDQKLAKIQPSQYLKLHQNTQYKSKEEHKRVKTITSTDTNKGRHYKVYKYHISQICNSNMWLIKFPLCFEISG